ncbi:MAG: hypothetical protein IJM27_01225 [Eubacterium sp.]|nr:hypothetical protein [Eubacterium sp.]
MAKEKKINTPGLGAYVLQLLSKKYPINVCDIGDDARLSKKGINLLTESYDVQGLGHLCIMRMTGLAGLMGMETVVLSTTTKDVPLLNLDWLCIFGKEIQIAELYDVQIEFQPERLLSKFQQIKDRDAEIKDYTSDETHWYDDIRYSCAYGKMGRRKVSGKLHRAGRDCARVFLAQTAAAPDCDPTVKMEKVRDYAEKLYAGGGPAVDMITGMFGEETAKRLVLRHMYGVDC